MRQAIQQITQRVAQQAMQRNATKSTLNPPPPKFAKSNF